MSKLSILANKFQTKLAQVKAPDMTSEEIASKLDAMKLEEAGPAIMASVAQALGLKNLQPNDLSFSELKYVHDMNGKAISWKMQVTPPIAQAFQAGVARMKQSAPSFSVATYVGQLLMQRFPGVKVLPGQPLAIG